MAKAYVTCTCKHCGKTFEKSTVKPNTREATRWEQWAVTYYDECEECYRARIKAEREAANAAAAQQAAEQGWPELTGTPKQVKWANELRAAYIKRIDEEAQSKGTLERDTYIEMKKFIIATFTDAKTWIDTRDNYDSMDRRAARAYKATQEAAAKQANGTTVEAVEPEQGTAEATTVAPAEQTHEGIVEIKADSVGVIVTYAKDDDFRDIVKGLEYRWIDGAWRKRITERTGTATERIAELGNKLLNASFAVRIADPVARAAAVSGDYTPQTYRWVDVNKGGRYDGWFSLSWPRDNGIYQAARAISGSRYEAPNVVVPAKNFDYVEDFANAYGFKFTKAARAAIEKQLASITMVTPAAPKTANYEEHNIADILNSSREVLDDLKEEE